jgi:hypothetical protein
MSGHPFAWGGFKVAAVRVKTHGGLLLGEGRFEWARLVEQVDHFAGATFDNGKVGKVTRDKVIAPPENLRPTSPDGLHVLAAMPGQGSQAATSAG